MRRYSTPTVDIVLEGLDATAMRVDVTFEQRGRELVVEDATKALDGEDTVVSVPLTQVQTGNFTEGTVEVQLDLFDGNGHRVPTTIGTIEVERTLRDREVEA